MDALLLGLVVVMGTAMWLVARWTFGRDGDVRVYGFWLSLTAATLSGLTLAGLGGDLANGPVWLAGGLMALAYAIGFIVLIQRCLQIGPVGPTVTINNAAMLGGVVASLAWLAPRVPNLGEVLGILGILAGLAILAMAREKPGQTGLNSAWLRLVIPGGLCSVLSFVCQAYVGVRHPGLRAGLLYTTVNFGGAALLLLLLIRSPQRLFAQPRLVAGGIVVGIMNGIGLPLSLHAMQAFGPEIVLPLTVALPMVLVALLARLLFRERLGPLAWTGRALTALALALLCYGHASG